MARKYNRKSHGRRKSRRSRKSSGQKSYTQYAGRLGPVAPRAITKLKYVENLAWTYLSGTANDYLFNLNSIFDPNRTGTGHQGYGFDSYQVLYNRYRVYAVSWRITIPASNDSAQICVVPNNTATAFSNFTLACESPRAMTKVLGYATGSRVTFAGHIRLPRLTGSTTVQYKADDRYQALTTASPSEVMCLHIVVNIPGGSNVTLYPVIQLQYHCEFFDPLELGQS